MFKKFRKLFNQNSKYICQQYQRKCLISEKIFDGLLLRNFDHHNRLIFIPFEIVRCCYVGIFSILLEYFCLIWYLPAEVRFFELCGFQRYFIKFTM